MPATTPWRLHASPVLCWASTTGGSVWSRRGLQPSVTEIRRTDIDRVHPWHTQDLVDVLHGLGRLDHRHDDQVVVGVVAVVAACVDRRSHRAPAPVAAWRVLARGDERLGLGARVDHRADDAV